MVAKEASNLAIGTKIWHPLSGHIFLGLVVEYWPFVGACTHHSYSKLYYLCFLSLFKLLPPPTLPHAPPTHPLIYTGPILMNSVKKNCQKLAKTSHYLLARLVVQKLIDN